MIEINMSLVHQYNYNGLYKRSIFRAYFFRFSLVWLSTNMYNLWARNTWIEIWIDIRWEEIYMEEDRDVTNFFRSFVKFLYFLVQSEMGMFINVENGSKRWASNSRFDKSSSRIWKLDGIMLKARLKEATRPSKGKATPNPHPTPSSIIQLLSSNLQSRVCTEAAVCRVIDTEHRAGKFPSVSWLGEFSFHEGGSRFP